MKKEDEKRGWKKRMKKEDEKRGWKKRMKKEDEKRGWKKRWKKGWMNTHVENALDSAWCTGSASDTNCGLQCVREFCAVSYHKSVNRRFNFIWEYAEDVMMTNHIITNHITTNHIITNHTKCVTVHNKYLRLPSCHWQLNIMIRTIVTRVNNKDTS